jgi:bacterioferritin (cytochrome b1)
MKSGKDFVYMVQAQIKFEKDTARKIKKLEEATANLAAKLFLAEMRFDTEKHAKILQTMLDVMKQREPEIAAKTLWDTKIHSYVDTLVARKMLDDHVKVETEMLSHVQEEMKKTDDEALKLLLRHIADDEKKHHEIMKTILKKAFKMGP